MPPDEGLALHVAGLAAAEAVPGAPIVEIGSWCGKSGIYLGAAARDGGTVLVAVDHHRGSEENQPGWEWHDPSPSSIPRSASPTRCPTFRRTIGAAGLEDNVVAVVATLAGGRRARWPGPSPSCSSMAATASSRPTPTTECMVPQGGRGRFCWPSTTCSPIPPTVAAPPTRSTCGRWTTASPRSSATGSLRVLRRR